MCFMYSSICECWYVYSYENYLVFTAFKKMHFPNNAAETKLPTIMLHSLTVMLWRVYSCRWPALLNKRIARTSSGYFLLGVLWISPCEIASITPGEQSILLWRTVSSFWNPLLFVIFHGIVFGPSIHHYLVCASGGLWDRLLDVNTWVWQKVSNWSEQSSEIKKNKKEVSFFWKALEMRIVFESNRFSVVFFKLQESSRN